MYMNKFNTDPNIFLKIVFQKHLKITAKHRKFLKIFKMGVDISIFRVYTCNIGDTTLKTNFNKNLLIVNIIIMKTYTSCM